MAVIPAVPHQQWLLVIQGLKDVIYPGLNGLEVLCCPPRHLNVGNALVHSGSGDISQFFTSLKHIAWEQPIHPGIKSWLGSLISGGAVKLAVAEKEVDLHRKGGVEMLGAKEAVFGCAGSQSCASRFCALDAALLVQAVQLTWGISWTAMEILRLAMLFSD